MLTDEIVREHDLVKAIRMLIPEDKPHGSNSLLGNVKQLVTGDTFVLSNQRFLVVGSELHRRVLEPDTPAEYTLTAEEEEAVSGMIVALEGCPELVEMLKTSTNEVVLFEDIDDVKIKVIIDVLNGGIGQGADLKTTSTRTRAAFIKSMRKYGYFRQAAIYKYVAKLDSFIFVAVTKKAPHRVFVVDTAEYEEEMAEAFEEAKVLIDTIKTCGRLIG